MKINFIGKLFKSASPQALAKRAEKNLQSRLVDWHTIMRDVKTGDFLEISTGKKFTGKFTVKAEDAAVEQIYKIKDGKASILLIRDNNANKCSAIRFSKNDLKSKPFQNEEALENTVDWKRLARAQWDADEQMRHQFVINELMKSGKDSIVIQGNY